MIWIYYGTFKTYLCSSTTVICACKPIKTRLYSAAISSVRCVKFVVYVVHTGSAAEYKKGLMID